MNLVVCPHCKSHRIVTSRVPQDVVAVMPCPSCGELVVLFRKKIMAVNREILERGSMDERRDHIATIIAEFIEPGMFSNENRTNGQEAAMARDKKSAESQSENDADLLPPISQHEIDEFTKVHLERLDNADYFRKHFG